MKNLFTPITIKNITFKNRIVMPPMCMYSAATDGVVTNFHKAHYSARALHGVGTIIIEATGVTPNGRISEADLGLWNDDQLKGFKDLVSFLKSIAPDVVLGIQLAHAGRKADIPGKIVAPSAIGFSNEYQTPHALTDTEIKEVVVNFAESAKRAVLAGFDFVEIHAAHGYLISEFLSPLTNKREDSYGGSVENRTKILGEIIDAVKKEIPADMPLFLRVSAHDYHEDGNKAKDMANIINIIKHKGVDVIDVSSGGVVDFAPKSYIGYQVAYAETIKQESNINVIAGGLIKSAKFADFLIADNRADFVYLGRELLKNPAWAILAAEELRIDLEYKKQYARAK